MPERHLSGADPALGKAISAVIAELKQPQRLPPSPYSSHFEALARSVVYQQLSGKAATAIYRKVSDGLGGRITPHSLSASSEKQLRAMGLSNAKSRYLIGLAQAVGNETIALDRLDEQSDEQVIESLTALSGIGRWTAQMFLMFRLRRTDVLPAGDLGVRKGYALVYGLNESLAAAEQVLAKRESWAPWCSIACLYLWRTIDVGYRAG